VPIAIAVDASDNVIVTGYSQIGREDIFHGGYHYPSDIYTAKYAGTNGAVLWEKRYDSPAHSSDAGVAIAIDANTNVIITGVSHNNIDDFGSFWDGDIYTAKYAGTDGALIWETRYNAFPGSEEAGGTVAVDASGNVLVAGYSSANATNLYKYDFYTAKYAAANGALLWEKRYNGPANQTDLASSVAAANSKDFGHAVAVDVSGNVVVTGDSVGTNFYNHPFAGPIFFPDYYTAKYAAADGALLWERRYSGPGESWGAAIALDPAGNVAVTGRSYSNPYVSGSYVADFYTAKYAAANGALLWEKRYNDAGNDDDLAYAVKFDQAGNVIVAGSSGGTNIDYYTAAYAAADGTLLWEKYYDGPIHGSAEPGGGRSSRPRCLALGPNGMIAITGASSSGSAYDYATIVYREAPALRITLSNSFAVLSWPAAFGNYQLQSNTNISASNGWSSVVAPRSTNNGFISVTSPPTNSRQFFRLSSP
jgi:hypothetical protein